jgi:HEAT repeat protein
MSMRWTHVVATIALAATLNSSLLTAQSDRGTSAAVFPSQSQREKRAAIAAIISNNSGLSEPDQVGVLGAAVEDENAHLREGALAGVVAIAMRSNGRPSAGPHVSPLQVLRGAVVRALSDDSAAVRKQAVLALANLDLDRTKPDATASPDTENLLVWRFYADPDTSVRRQIVAGFSLETTRPSGAVAQLLRDASNDSEVSIREYAATGAMRLDDPGGQLVRLLDDPESRVRLAAARVIARLGRQASGAEERLITGLRSESDQAVRAQLEVALRAVRNRSIP